MQRSRAVTGRWVGVLGCVQQLFGFVIYITGVGKVCVCVCVCGDRTLYSLLYSKTWRQDISVRGIGWMGGCGRGYIERERRDANNRAGQLGKGQSRNVCSRDCERENAKIKRDPVCMVAVGLRC